MKTPPPPKTDVFSKLPHGTVCLNAFNYGQNQWKSSGKKNKKFFNPYIQIVQVLAGDHKVECCGQSATITAGNIYLIPPHTSFNLIAKSDSEQGFTKTRWMQFHATIFKTTDLADLFILPLAPNQETTAEISGIFDTLYDKIDHTDSSRDLWNDAYRSHWGFKILCTLCEIGTLKSNWRDIVNETDRLKKVLLYIQENLGKKITPAKLATQTSLSLSQFHTVFRKKTGRSPLEYIHQMRLDEASRQLITSDESLRLIAEKTGFYDEFHFSRAFKKYFKTTPSAFRKSQQNAKQ